ncbi:MAG TPA: oligosaccharide flippase family protein [Anaerolineales bacterium]|nr:oligosaccharide flippase family protein [Anaerolineales bacterium]
MDSPDPGQRSTFFTSVLKLVSGTTLAQLITVVTAPIISRLFTPQAFGILYVFTSMITIVSVVICLRYEFAIVLPESDEDAANLVGLCVLVAIGISILVGLLLLILGRPLVNLLNAPNLYGFLWLIPIGLLTLGFFQALNYWNTRTKHFGRLSIARVSASFTTSALPIFLGLLGSATAGGLIFSYIAGALVFTCVLGYQVLKESGAFFYRFIQRTRMRVNLKRYRKFPLVDSWGSFINNLSWQLPSLMLLYFFSETVVGYYSLSNRLILLPLTLLGNSIAQVLYQHSAELRSNPDQLSRTVQSVFHRLVAVGLFPAVVLAVAGPQLFTIVFGAGWTEAGRYAQILSPWMFVLFISTPLGNLFATLERQELSLVVNSVILVTRFASLAIGGLTHNIYLTLVIWSVSGVLVYAGLALWLLNLTHVSVGSAFRSIFQFLLYASLPALLLLGILKLITLNAFWVILLTILSISVYYALVLARDRGLRNYLVALLPKGLKRAG